MLKRVAVTYRYPKKVVPYEEALQAVGVDPVVLRPEDGRGSLDGVDGLLLSGGTDINPARYGALPDVSVADVDDERDDLEMRMLSAAIAADLPVLAICRGLQLLNVYHGGTLVQDMPGHRVVTRDASDPVHGVMQEAGSHLARIFGTGPTQVNSRHHQSVDRLGERLVVTSRAVDDGVIEGLERPDLRFVVGVQWHPEDQVSRFAEQRRLFETFAAAL